MNNYRGYVIDNSLFLPIYHCETTTMNIVVYMSCGVWTCSWCNKYQHLNIHVVHFNIEKLTTVFHKSYYYNLLETCHHPVCYNTSIKSQNRLSLMYLRFRKVFQFSRGHHWGYWRPRKGGSKFLPSSELILEISSKSIIGS